ncbi:MAG: MFS transporter [Alphaproteobacteria bacterium]|nr:MFS transporter [Alphaproteobacteria bacterium]
MGTAGADRTRFMPNPSASLQGASLIVRVVLVPLGITFVLQMMVSVLQMTIPVLAPVLTAEAGLAPERIGNFTSLSFIGALWFLTINAQVMPITGPLRLLQIGNLIAATGLLLVLPGTWWALLVAALLLGIGYGPTPPAGSQILATNTPARMRSLVFSIKQAGVPLGGAIAGLGAPWLAVHYGWRTAIVVIAGTVILSVVAVQPWRQRFDVNRQTALGFRPSLLLRPSILREPVRAMRLSPALLPLTYAGASFAVVQGSVFSFLVTYLVDDVGLALATAGMAFAALQIVGVAARVGAGWFADRIGSARRTLILLSVFSAAMAVLLSTIDRSWPIEAIVLVCGTAGLAVASWNGVYLSEVARVAPPDAVGDATAGSTFFVFIGYVIGPSTFAALVQVTGSYSPAFWTIGALVLTAGGVLWRLEARRT